MKSCISLVFSIVFLFGAGLASGAFAQTLVEDEAQGLDYEALVRKLTPAEDSTTYSLDPLDDVKIHTGVGLSNSVFTVNHDNGDKTYAAQRGVQVSLGIDLFSRNWLAEGSFRNFGESTYENATIRLKEFDLKVIYHSGFAPAWAYKVGAGITARYLDVDYAGRGSRYSTNYQTPASVVQGGVYTYLSSKVSVGADISSRNTLIDDTPDRVAYDMTLRLDGHF